MVTGKNGCNSCTDYWSCLLHLNQQWPSTFSIWNYDSLHPHCDFTSLSTAFVQPLLVPFLSLLCVFFFWLDLLGIYIAVKKQRCCIPSTKFKRYTAPWLHVRRMSRPGQGTKVCLLQRCREKKRRFLMLIHAFWGGWERGGNDLRYIYIYIHPWNLTWNLKMMVWKIIFLSKWLISRFYVNLPGCIYKHSI